VSVQGDQEGLLAILNFIFNWYNCTSCTRSTSREVRVNLERAQMYLSLRLRADISKVTAHERIQHLSRRLPAGYF
jgi:hypothetical protein